MSASKLPDNVDTIIVGAGVSGLYCAWRLLQDDPTLKIAIVERLNRTGGRLDTDLIQIDNPDGDGSVTVREEEGGMRFTYEMKELMSLFYALGLCDEAVYFPMNTNRYSFRGHSFTYCESLLNDNAIWGQIYDLAPAELNQSPGSLLNTVYERIVMENTGSTPPADPTPEYWQDFRLAYRWKGVPLNQWTMWGLLADMGYSEECITMFSQSLGFEGPFLSMVNAGEAWQILEDFPKNPHYFTFKYGFSTLIKALVAEIEKITGNVIHLGVNVDSITRASDGYDVQLTRAKGAESALPFESGAQHTIRGSRVILAVARKAMENLFVASPVLNGADNSRQIHEDIGSVLDMTLMKINLYFQEPWWQNGLSGQEPVLAGPSFTDLPINAVYPFYPIDGASPTSPAALTIYCDFNKANFWNGLQNVGPLFQSPLQEKYGKTQVVFAASQAVVKEAQRQLRQLFNTHYVPEPVLTSFRSWSGQDGFGYAYHQWALNVDDCGVIERMVRPVPGEEIYTCNESWSDMQGWVNGSLRSCELVLRELDLKPIVDEHRRCAPKDAPEGPTCVDGKYVHPEAGRR